MSKFYTNSPRPKKPKIRKYKFRSDLTPNERDVVLHIYRQIHSGPPHPRFSDRLQTVIAHAFRTVGGDARELTHPLGTLGQPRAAFRYVFPDGTVLDDLHPFVSFNPERIPNDK